VIIFDCDGVIFDSNTLKSEAFRRTLLDFGYPDVLVEDFVSYHQKKGGISRYVKFKTFITDFLNIKFEKEPYDKLLRRFSLYCVKLYENADYTPFLIEFLEKYKDSMQFYVVSGSDEIELNKVFENRGLKKYFKKILGSPKTKKDCVQLIINENRKKKIVMFGDSKSDFIAAKGNNINFIYMKKFSESKDEMTKLSKKLNFRLINTFKEIIGR